MNSKLSEKQGFFKGVKNQDWLFMLAFLVAFFFMLWKCRYGFGGNDEAFYLSVPYRLTQGDSLIKDEWHLSQLSGLLLVPFTALYRAFVHSADGIILAFRVIYVLCHSAASVFIYCRIRKYGIFSAVGTVMYFLFTPFDIMALSYNTMGLDLLSVCGVILATAVHRKKLQCLCAGVLFAMAVLCCPMLALVYIAAAVGTLAVWGVAKFCKKCTPALQSVPKLLGMFTVGCGAVAVVFFAYLLSCVSINDIVNNLPYILSDPEHLNLSLWQQLVCNLQSFNSITPAFWFIAAGYGVVAVIMLVDKGRQKRCALYLGLTFVIVGVMFLNILPSVTTKHFNTVMLSMFFWSVTAYILLKNRPKRMFVGVFLLGMAYAVVISFSSNQMLYVISMAAAMSNIAGAVFTDLLYKELCTNVEGSSVKNSTKNICVALACVLFTGQTLTELYVKYTHCFWESLPTTELTVEIKKGPAKGIYTNTQNAVNYNILYSDIQQSLGKGNGENVLFLTNTTWCYMAAEGYSCGTFSAWIGSENERTLEHFVDYYSVNTHKIPQKIYIPKNLQWNFEKIIAEAKTYNYTADQSSTAYILTQKAQ